MSKLVASLGLLLMSATLVSCGGASPKSSSSPLLVRGAPSVGTSMAETTPTTSNPDLYNGVSQSALQACIAAGEGNCEASVPGLQACMAAQQQCNRDAAQGLAAARAKDADTAAGPLSQAEVESMALALSTDPSNASVESAVNETYAQLMAGGQGDIAPYEASTAMLWVVNVHGPMLTDGSPSSPPRQVDEYGAVYDQATHSPLETCIGGPC
jgi:hypothetical protein